MVNLLSYIGVCGACKLSSNMRNIVSIATVRPEWCHAQITGLYSSHYCKNGDKQFFFMCTIWYAHNDTLLYVVACLPPFRIQQTIPMQSQPKNPHKTVPISTAPSDRWTHRSNESFCFLNMSVIILRKQFRSAYRTLLHHIPHIHDQPIFIPFRLRFRNHLEQTSFFIVETVLRINFAVRWNTVSVLFFCEGERFQRKLSLNVILAFSRARNTEKRLWLDEMVWTEWKSSIGWKLWRVIQKSND